MKNQLVTPIPAGLPRRFVGGKAGYDALCTYLGIDSRERKLQIVKQEPVKTFLKWCEKRNKKNATWIGLKQSPRLQHQICHFYSDPDMRRVIWNPSSSVAPSLERIALSGYLKSEEDLIPDQERLKDCNGFYSDELPVDGIREVGLAMLPKLKDQFQSWESYTGEEQSEIVLAGFATATLLNDIRLLAWASDLHEDIAREYCFISVEDTHDGTSEAGSSKPQLDLRSELKHRAVKLIGAVEALLDGPLADAHFELVSERSKGLLDLREDYLQFDKSARIEQILTEFEEYVIKTSDSHTWLVEESADIFKEWHTSYPATAHIDLDTLTADIDRVRMDFVRLLEEVDAARLSFQLAASQHAEYHESLSQELTRSQRKKRTELDTQRLKSEQALLEAEDAVLMVLGPSTTIARDEKGTSIDSKKPDTKPTTHTGNDVQAPSMNTGTASDPAKTDSSTETSKRTPTKKTNQSPGGVAKKTKVNKSPPQPSSPIIEKPVQTALTPTQESLWEAIAEGKFGLAYHIAHYDLLVNGESNQPSPDLLAALALGREVSRPFDAIGNELSERADALSGSVELNDGDIDFVDALNLLVFSATARGVIFTSQRGTTSALARQVTFSDRLSSVGRLLNAIVQIVETLQGVEFDLSALRVIVNQDVWQRQFSDLRVQVSQWREGVHSTSFKTQLIRDIWQHWCANGAWLDELASLLSSETMSNVARVNEITGQMSDRKFMRNLIDTTARTIREQRLGPVEGPGLSQLERNIEDVCDHAELWKQLVATKPGESGFVRDIVEKLRVTLEKYTPTALKSLGELASSSSAQPLEIAVQCTIESIQSLNRLFVANDEESFEEIDDPQQILADDLLLVSELILDEEVNVIQPLDDSEVLTLLTDRTHHKTTLADAFEARLSIDDLLGASTIKDRLEKADDDLSVTCSVQLDQAISKTRSQLRDRLYRLAERLEHAFVVGEIDGDDQVELLSRIEDVDHSLGVTEGVLRASHRVDEIATTIDGPFSRGLESLRSKLQDYVPRADEREEELLQEVLQREDLATLQEHLDCLENDQPLVSPVSDRSGSLQDFLRIADRIENDLDGDRRPRPDDFIDAARTRRDYFGLEFSELSPEQGEHATRLLSNWYTLARLREFREDSIAELFSNLGFSLIEKGIEITGSNTANLRTEPLRDRELCPTHAFGSDADGSYRVILNFNSPARESIVQAVGHGDPNSHTLVLHFGKLSLTDRKSLRKWSINHPTQFITIDESMMLYLASLSGDVLRAMFDCTLPFTSIEPYFTSPGFIPPESFFGRERELRSILDRYGSCFVYGGRQLGKTALLRVSKDAFHDPSRDRLAAFVDLKYHDVGVVEEADHLWQVIWNVLVDLKVIPNETVIPQGQGKCAEGVEKAVVDWVGSREDGRILLLLDEADDFLAKDHDRKTNFGVSTGLKGIMDKTDRNFKVVLCGLHNVLRNVERANHPLAHFGEPICVGPLLNNGDLESARELVREPMYAAGYRFASSNLITKILLWTNYYPSLIQILGERLLRHLRNKATEDFPSTVSHDDLHAVLAYGEFRDYIRRRFLLTLQLDSRYEVIAYSMAFELKSKQGGLTDGLTEHEIRALARAFWAEGFDETIREFQTLLQEMCGLGVLRQCSNDASEPRFTFRNPNVLRLLGDDETIIQTLEIEREKPELFEAFTYHACFESSHDGKNRRYGPPTFEQESVLKRGERVALLCGNEACRIDIVPEFLEKRPHAQELYRFQPSGVNRDALRKQLTALRPDTVRRPDRSVRVYLVDQTDLWNFDWIEDCARTLRNIARGNYLRVVFLANSDRLWDFIAELPSEHLGVGLPWFDMIAVKPWDPSFIRRWCIDHELHDANVKGKVDELFQLTGGWPVLLDRFAESSERNWNGRVAELGAYIDEHHEPILEGLGLTTPMSRFELAPLFIPMGPLQLDDAVARATLWNEMNSNEIDSEKFQRRMVWATYLGLLQETHDGLEVNPLVNRILPSALP